MENEDYKKKYDQLAGKVRVMLTTQKSYFKTKNIDLLKTAKALEKEVDELVNPKTSAISQGKLDWLGQ